MTLNKKPALLVLGFNLVVIVVLCRLIYNIPLAKYPRENGVVLSKRAIFRNDDGWFWMQKTTQLPIIYVITPTYARASRIPDLTRLINTLLHVERLHWIVIEDGLDEAPEVTQLLKSSGISFTYLIVPRPAGVNKYLKGVTQRNAGLRWIRQNHDPLENGVFYFADDDNSYSVELFREMRYTKKISIWPVGFAGKSEAEYPVVKNSKVIGFAAAFYPSRTFAVDMAGFALNVKVLFDYPNMKFQYNATYSFQESEFLIQCCTRQELEPKADNCTKVLVWHTKTVQPQFEKPETRLFNETTKRKQKFRTANDSLSILTMKETVDLLYRLKARLKDKDD